MNWGALQNLQLEDLQAISLGRLGGGYLGKLAEKKLRGNMENSALMKAYQAAYPGLNGVQPTGAVQAPQISPQVGDMIKNLMIGSVY